MDTRRYACDKTRFEPSDWSPSATSDPRRQDMAPLLRSATLVESWDTKLNGFELAKVNKDWELVAWYWRCPKGHLWQEPISSVKRGGAWKQKDPRGMTMAACRECVLELHGARYAECGHVSTNLDLISKPITGALPHEDCWECLSPERREAKVARGDRRRQERRILAGARKSQHRLWLTEISLRDYDGSLGGQFPSPGRPGSKLQTYCLDALSGLGIGLLQDTAIRVPNLIENDGSTWLLTPDAIVGNVCIEIDNPGPKKQISHNRGFPADDLYRDDCLRAVGYTVVRLRTAGLREVPDSINFCVAESRPKKSQLEEFVEVVQWALSAH